MTTLKTIWNVLAVIAAIAIAYFSLTYKPAVTDLPVGEAAEGKINITMVCDNALSYMTFPDAASAETFVADCKEGKHPEVIERYKADLELGDGAQI